MVTVRVGLWLRSGGAAEDERYRATVGLYRLSRVIPRDTGYTVLGVFNSNNFTESAIWAEIYMRAELSVISVLVTIRVVFVGKVSEGDEIEWP